MLRKLKVAGIVGIALQFLRVLAPDLHVPDGFEGQIETLVNALLAVVPIVVAWFVPERQSNIAALRTKGFR